MKRILILWSVILVCGLYGCQDFFEPSTNDVLSGDDYISAQTETYTGFLGIVTKVQEVGDKAIYLTDTRADILEPTANTPSELIAIYNYADDLSGNSYADPAPYYEVVIACNDYISNMFEYKEKYTESIDEDHFSCLISSAIRFKVWAYLTIAEIYGEALWFDDPMIKIQQLTDTSKFEIKDIDEVVTACLDLLETGVNGVDGKLTFSWYEWLDPETTLGESIYRFWDYMVPPYEGLFAELCLWAGRYQDAADVLLKVMDDKIKTSLGDVDWIRNAYWKSAYARTWNYSIPYDREVVCAILYDYENNQTNELLKHFGTEYPNEYLLRPSQVAMDKFVNTTFNPGGASDARSGVTFKKDSQNRYYIAKFRPNADYRAYPYQDDVHIYIYRIAQYHMMLIEALNNLGRFTAADAFFNMGLGAAFPAGGIPDNYEWSGITDYWTSSTPDGTRKYPNLGMRGALELSSRSFIKVAANAADTLAAKKTNDEAIMDEMLLEFPCEGKVYPALIRAARRWNDYNIVADRVCPKYEGRSEEIRAKILAGAYFVPWDLQISK